MKALKRAVLDKSDPDWRGKDVIWQALDAERPTANDAELRARRSAVAASVRRTFLAASVPGLALAVLAAYFVGPVGADLLDVPASLGAALIIAPIVLALWWVLPRR